MLWAAWIVGAAGVVAAMVGSSTPAVAQTGESAVRLDSVYAVGALDAPDEELFGANVTGAVTATGEVYVGDGASGTIRLFDASGQFVRETGSRGRGPGEFSGITRLVLSGDSLYVLDAVQRRISVFTAPALEFARAVSFAMNGHGVFDFARLPDGSFALFGVEYDGDAVVHRYSADGTRLRSIAELLEIDDALNAHPVGRTQAGVTYGTVFPDGDLVVALAAPYRMMRVGAGGTVRWRTSDDLLPKPWEGYITATDESFRVDPYPQIVSVERVGDDRILVHAVDASVDSEPRGWCDLVDASTGQRLQRWDCPGDAFLQSVRPGDAGSGWSVWKRAEPFPQLTVFRYTLTETDSRTP
jgi:DNA-binding beta-propeller fold protein YncE